MVHDTHSSMQLSSSSDAPFTTPILFLIFNRLETTKKVFEAIRKAKPTRLYIAADGPRENKVGEAEKCEEVRQWVTVIDWECEVRTLFRTENWGCGKGLSGAITWFFEHESEGIILEDDCLPSPSFFTFCAELLERYRDDTRVMEIGSNNFEPTDLCDQEHSYRFSKLTYIWGWATWRRAWKLYDFNMSHYEAINKKRILEVSYDTIYERDFFQYVFEKMYKGDGKISSRTIWSYQWQFACMINSGLIIVPNRNLVINLGFGDQATNTHDPKAAGYDLTLEVMEFPLKHPEFMMINRVKDMQVFKTISTSWSSRIKSQLKSVIPKPVLQKLVLPIKAIFS